MRLSPNTETLTQLVLILHLFSSLFFLLVPSWSSTSFLPLPSSPPCLFLPSCLLILCLLQVAGLCLYAMSLNDSAAQRMKKGTLESLLSIFDISSSGALSFFDASPPSVPSPRRPLPLLSLPSSSSPSSLPLTSLQPSLLTRHKLVPYLLSSTSASDTFGRPSCSRLPSPSLMFQSFLHLTPYCCCCSCSCSNLSINLSSCSCSSFSLPHRILFHPAC